MKSKNIKERLIRVERDIAIYKKGEDESPIKEINIDVIPLDKLKTIVEPKEDDPLLYDGYIPDQRQLDKINHIKSLEIDLDLEKYLYVLECRGINEWQ